MTLRLMGTRTAPTDDCMTDGLRPAERGTRADHLATTLWQYLFAVIVCLVLGRGYFGFIPAESSGWGRLANLAAFVSTCILLNLVAFLAVAPPSALLRRPWFTLGVAPIPFALISIFVYADTIVYALFRFHINGMVLNLLTTNGAGDSYTFGWGTVLSSVKAVVLILSAHGLFSLLLLRRLQGRGLLPRPGRLAAWAVPALALVVVCDKTCFLLGDLYNVPEITRARHLFPLYRPVVMRQFAQNYLGVRIAREDALTLNNDMNALLYPKAPIRLSQGGRRPNVLVVAIEGCRYDMLDREVMPFLDRWSKTQLTFTRHYSGGNASRFGVFSLLYGIYGTYWHKVLAERQGPALINELRRLGYSFRVLSCVDLNFPEFRKTAFIELPAVITDDWPCPRTDRDRALTDSFVEFIGSARAPFFAFAFYDASHQPYLYPPEHEIFTPVLDKKALDYTSFAAEKKKVSPLLRNRFKNSLHYIDSQIARVVEALERSGLMDSTLVFITGDHGEEFNELGAHGHNGTFDRYQTRTVMVAHVPGQAPREVTRITSHLDVVPTVFSFMGVMNPASDYTQGSPMTDPAGPPYAVVASWDSAALVTENATVVFGTETTNAGFDVFDADYQPIPASRGPGRAVLLDVVRRMHEFSR